MSITFLEKIVAKTHLRVESAKLGGYLPKLQAMAVSKAELNASKPSFYDQLARPGSVNIIAEIKRSSPSKGVINASIDVARVSQKYSAGGAAAISVLTEPEYFDGTIGDLVKVVNTVDLPVLRKDFIVNEYQIVEAAAAGARAILLIAAALDHDILKGLYTVATDLALDVLVEVHDLAELDAAANIGAKIIGINNRDLHSLEVSLDTSRRLAGHRPDNCLLVAESGLSSKTEIDELQSLGFNGFLIGETLMRSGDPASSIGGMIA